MKKQTLHYVHDSWVEEPTISLFDLSVIRGFGIFDFLRTYHKKPFKLSEHVDRLFRSAKQLGITVPKTKSQIEKIVLAGIQKNNYKECIARIVVSGGVSPDGISKTDTSTFAVLFTEAKDYPLSYYTKGVKIISREFERSYPQAKSLNYLTAVNVLSEAKKEDAIEVLYLDHHRHILEGTTSNFFAVIGGKLITPKENILFGITRNVVVTLAQKLRIPLLETDLLYSQIPLFDEACITASNKEVMPVVKIDDQQVGNGKVGALTKKLITSYRKLL
ncbi:aminotransferase class IV family protein [Candidatus Roizmanbacteria bacterium]|nr:aminotransferase class IV family protein [Candidatus Roizmanbacteria bacterium]